jgi:hypothetical protein
MSIRVTFIRHGEIDYVDFACAEDAARFATWGTDVGAFIRPEATPLDDGQTQTALDGTVTGPGASSPGD